MKEILALAEQFEALATGRHLFDVVLEAIRLKKDPWQYAGEKLRADRRQVSDALFALFEQGKISHSPERGYHLMHQPMEPKPQPVVPYSDKQMKEDKRTLQNQKLWEVIMNAKSLKHAR